MHQKGDTVCCSQDEWTMLQEVREMPPGNPQREQLQAAVDRAESSDASLHTIKMQNTFEAFKLVAAWTKYRHSRRS